MKPVQFSLQVTPNAVDGLGVHTYILPSTSRLHTQLYNFISNKLVALFGGSRSCFHLRVANLYILRVLVTNLEI